MNIIKLGVAVLGVALVGCGAGPAEDSQQQAATAAGAPVLGSADDDLTRLPPEPEPPTTCLMVKCTAGSHCVDSPKGAYCEPDLGPLPPIFSCDAVKCAAGFHCEELAGGATCVADDGTTDIVCKTDADCRLEADFCDACACAALGSGQALPVCLGTAVACFADPCDGYKAVCVANRCELAK